MKDLEKFIKDQLSQWPMACENFRNLKNVETKTLAVGGLQVILQHNPARIVSSAAKTDAASLKQRKCFLCKENRFPEQIKLKFEGRKGKKYDFLLNPYPIFPNHLVIAMEKHTEQSIWRRFVDLLDMSTAYRNYVFFYNGPKCGASAPDHHHFQAAPKGLMPLIVDADSLLNEKSPVLEYVSSVRDADVYHYRKFLNGIFVIRAETSKSAAKMFYRLIDCADIREGDNEPRFNLFSWHTGDEYRCIVVFRTTHRSHHYFSEGPDHLTMSPGCADMAGCLVVPVAEDFEKLDESLLTGCLKEITIDDAEQSRILWRLTRSQQELSVGIMSAKEIDFEILSDGAGPRRAILREGKIEYDGSLYDELFFEARTLSTMFAEPTFILYGVTIGVDFHWERKENQKFAGALKIIVEKDRLTAVNVIGVEDYLVSVISSEMKSSASLEFLKAHAVISRSWILSQIAMRGVKKVQPVIQLCNTPQLMSYLDSLNHKDDRDVSGEYVKWYDKQDHKNFDVCADDHCQRYQGLTRLMGETAKEAVDATWGQILTYGDEICDARFSKCCGGVTEVFSTCWEDADYPYLQSFPDTDGEAPEPFCGMASDEVLSQVLNSYDMETKDFYRWIVRYDRDRLTDLFNRKSGLEVGDIYALIPVHRGPSGRLSRLKIVGSLRTVVVGKELEIRKMLSETHLKSSAFEVGYIRQDGSAADQAKVEEDALAGRSPEYSGIILRGSGWGHGVGLCQIGAAVMASQGYDYQSILLHYYPGAKITARPADDL